MELLEREGTPNIFVDREYVYVPSGASGYVDEFICQIDRYQDLWYILQDVNSNVIALTDSGGEVVRQHTFDPYGEILTAEDFDTHHGIKVGHQGLFFDRLELPAATSGSVSLGSATQLQPGVFGLYQARNRVLLSRYGRWAQKDPNASGMLHAELWHDGQQTASTVVDPSFVTALQDGLHLFVPFRHAPLVSTDPHGLFLNGIFIELETRAAFISPYPVLFGAANAAMFANDVHQTLTDQQHWLELMIDGLFAIAGQKLFDAAFDAYQGTRYARNATRKLSPTELAKEIGDIGENWLKAHFTDKTQRVFQTSMGPRRVDLVEDGTLYAHESKTGYKILDKVIRTQIAKDAELKQSGQVAGYTWHFFVSPHTGLGGAHKDVLLELQ